jgi:predicted ribosome quality control (RQC) complex YloA/Tae2 family protein
MTLTAKEIGYVVDSLNRGLLRAIVRKIISPQDPDRIAIAMRTAGENHILQIATTPSATRLGRITDKPASAPSPHPFVMLLRKELTGLIFQGAIQIRGDRAVELQFSGKDREGALVCELTSRHANMFWLDAKRHITGSFYPNRSYKRQLVPGEPYVPLIPRPYQVQTRARFDEDLKGEEQIEKYYSRVEEARQQGQAAAGVARLASRAARYLDRLEAKLKKELTRAQRGDSLAQFGHLLKANLHRAKKGQDSLAVLDFEGREAVIPLDPKRTPVANMERFYAKAKRLKRAAPKIKERRDEIRSKRAQMAEVLQEIEEADPERLEAMEKEMREAFPFAARRVRSKKTKQETRIPFREYAIAAGRPARVGRSARDNDELTLRHSGPNDLWLHVRGRTGSHVVVPMGRGEDPSSELLVDAAHLAAHFSEAKDDMDVDVIYTKRRYVQKPKGAAPGSVRLLQEKTISLRVEKKRLERLMAAKTR